jgi:hypothetical protein
MFQSTSVEAHESIKPLKPTLQQLVFEKIRNHPVGLTDEQIQNLTGLRTQSETARRNELVKLGLVKDSGLRRVASSGRKAIVWVATQKAA